MTETRKPPPCHYDRGLGERVTKGHRDDCTTPTDHQACIPCTAPHCLVCGREHTDNATPDTCPSCEGRVTDDLDDIAAAYTALAIEAMDAGRDGHLVAAAPIPGGTAAVLIGPTVRLDMFRTYHGFRDDHRRNDPMPPLAVLAQWEDVYRAWLEHDTKPEPTQTAKWGETITGPRRATIGGAIAYLKAQLPYLANHVTNDAPDWLAFTRQIRKLRAECERALHDEREPERGVECFECGDTLVRRFRTARRCRHSTPARRRLVQWMQRRAVAQDWLRVIGTYPELGGPRQDDLRSAAAPPASLIAAARIPCTRCVKAQGGIDNPDPGRSWECPGCRREYTPGEYANAVRRDLVDHGSEGDGWTHVTMAAEAASTLVGLQVAASTVRKWMDRGKVTSLCLWTPGRPWGQRLVFWPDVADEVVEAVERARVAAEKRRIRAEQLLRLADAVAAGEAPEAAGVRLGIHPARLEVLMLELESGKVSA